MTDLNFDLNIYHYTDDELKKFLCIENNYTINILKKKINILKKNIFSLHLSNGEKNEFDTFLNKMEIRLLKDLEKIEIKKIKKDLNDKIKQLKKEIEGNEENEENEENEKKVEKKIKKN